MTKGDLRAKLARALDADPTTPGTWTTAQLDAIMADAHELLCEQTEPIERAANVPYVAGRTYYRLSAYASDCILPLRMFDTVTYRRLIPVSILELDNNSRVWETTTGTPIWWAPVGWDWFAIYPQRASNQGILRMEYSAWPVAALDDSTPLEINEDEEDEILSAALADSHAWQRNAAAAAQSFSEFSAQIRTARSKAQRSLFRLSRGEWMGERTVFP